MKCHAARPRSLTGGRRATASPLGPCSGCGGGRLLKRHKIHSAEAVLFSLQRSLAHSPSPSIGKWQSGAHSISTLEVGKKGGGVAAATTLGSRKSRVKREYRKAWHIGTGLRGRGEVAAAGPRSRARRSHKFWRAYATRDANDNEMRAEK